MIKVAHFLRDDNKFIPDSIRCFDKFEGIDNTFFCVSGHKKVLARLNNPRVIIITETSAKEIIINKCNYDIICLHSLYSLPLYLIPIINKSVKLVWYSWGYDIYMNPAPFSPLLNDISIYLPNTEELLYHLPNDGVLLRTKVKRFIMRAFSKKEPNDLLDRCIERVDYFAGVFPIEHELLTNKNRFFHAHRISHNYIHPEEFKRENIQEEIDITGCNIQLGHSACPEDNHIDMMTKLVDHVEGSAEIICPLSYGGPKNYISAVIEKGHYFFGDRFKPITNFLPLDEYTRLQKSCNRFVLGAIRQQATCNCLTAMWNGIQLYLPKTSMNYIQYHRFGLEVFDIDSGINNTIRKDQHIRNREIIESIYSYRAWERDLNAFIEIYNLSFASDLSRQL